MVYLPQVRTDILDISMTHSMLFALCVTVQFKAHTIKHYIYGTEMTSSNTVHTSDTRDRIFLKH